VRYWRRAAGRLPFNSNTAPSSQLGLRGAIVPLEVDVVGPKAHRLGDLGEYSIRGIGLVFVLGGKLHPGSIFGSRTNEITLFSEEFRKAKMQRRDEKRPNAVARIGTGFSSGGASPGYLRAGLSDLETQHSQPVPCSPANPEEAQVGANPAKCLHITGTSHGKSPAPWFRSWDRNGPQRLGLAARKRQAAARLDVVVWRACKAQIGRCILLSGRESK
jgi:hypothetical protein